MDDKKEELAQRLDDIADQLGDLALTSLREHIEAEREGRPEEERELTRARRAVEKAASLLR